MANPIFKAVQRAARVLTDKSPWGTMTSPWQVPMNYNIQDYLKAYGEIGWLFGCVSRIGQAVGEADLRLYVERQQRDGTTEREEIHKHPLLDLMDYVNPFQTGYEFRMESQYYLDLVGNSFWYVVNNGLGVPAELWTIPPAFMRPVPDPQNFLAGWVFQMGATQIPFNLDEVIWLHYPNPANPYWGIGPAQSIAVDLQTEQYSARWNRNYFYNDAAIGTTIIYPEELGQDEYERIKEQWQARHQGLGRAHKVAVLSGGAKIEKAVISQRDMDFWKLRKLNRDNILGAFGMPASVMGISENVNRANAESGEYVFARWTIKPRLKLLASKLTEQLAVRYDPKLKVEFNDPVPADREQLRKETEGALAAGYMTINQARQSMGESPFDGGDILLIPNNRVMIRVENNKIPDELPQPAPKVPPAKALAAGHQHRALYDNEADKELHWAAWVEKALKNEVVIDDQLKSMFAKQQKEALGNLTEGGAADQQLINPKKAKLAYADAVTEELTKTVTISYDDATELVAPDQPHAGKAAMPASYGGIMLLGTTKADEPPVPFAEAMKWLKTRIGWAAAETSEETAVLLADQLAAGFAAGEGMPDLAKRVQSVFTFCDKTRAKMIARTETIMASNEGALRGYEEVGVKQSEFYAALDERTCESCMDLHGEVRKVKNSHGIIPVHPNCRCTWLPVVE